MRHWVLFRGTFQVPLLPSADGCSSHTTPPETSLHRERLGVESSFVLVPWRRVPRALALARTTEVLMRGQSLNPSRSSMRGLKGAICNETKDCAGSA